MAKKKKIKFSRTKHFFFKTRIGFYTLVATAGVLSIAGINTYGSANFEKDILGEKSEANRNSDERKSGKEASDKHQEKIEEIHSEFNVKLEDIKVKFEKKEDKVERKISHRKEDKLELSEEEEDSLEDEIEQEFESENELEIASGGGEVTIKKAKVKARTGFPLSLDLATNQLIVTRPDGTTKAVTVLPDKAVENFMRHKKINLLNFEDPNGSPSAQPGDNTGTQSAVNTGNDTEISIIERDDQIVYKIKGKKKLNLFGIFPVTTPTTGYVSAETGEVVDQEEPLITKIFDLISP